MAVASRFGLGIILGLGNATFLLLAQAFSSVMFSSHQMKDEGKRQSIAAFWLNILRGDVTFCHCDLISWSGCMEKTSHLMLATTRAVEGWILFPRDFWSPGTLWLAYRRPHPNHISKLFARDDELRAVSLLDTNL